MPRQLKEEREARRRRVWELHGAGLGERKIAERLNQEGYKVSDSTVHNDLRGSVPSQITSSTVLPFYCNGLTQNFPNCCFSHRVGMPTKTAIWYDYQLEIVENMVKYHEYALIKSRRIGATEIVLRNLLYQGVFGVCKTYQVLIIPGTRADLANRHIRHLRDLLERGGYSDIIDYDRTKQGDLYLKDGTEFIGSPSDADAMRGLPNVNFIFMDEAAFFDTAGEQTNILSAVQPMLNITNGWLTVVSTPNGKRGFFYGLVSEHNAWYKQYIPHTRTLGKLMSVERAKHLKADQTLDFEQEFNCQFSTPENAVYTKRFLDFATGDFSLVEFSDGDWRISPIPKFTMVYGGLDIARAKDFTSLVLLGKVERKWFPLIIKIYPHQTWPTILDDLKLLYKEYRVQTIAADKTSLGQGFIDFVVAENMNVDSIQFTNQMKTDMINHNKKLFQSQELQLQKEGCPEIRLQFEEQMFTDTGSGKRYSHPEKRHDDALWAWHLAAMLVGQHSEQFISLL